MMEQAGRWLFEELDDRHAPSRPLWDAAAITFGLRLLRLSGANRYQSGRLAVWQQRRPTDCLTGHLGEEITLEQLAEVPELSTLHFARASKRSTGLPSHIYLRRLCCEKAKEVLTRSNLSITEIAARVGDETPQAFAHMFPAEVGASPASTSGRAGPEHQRSHHHRASGA